jgi:hypothetical protein
MKQQFFSSILVFALALCGWQLSFAQGGSGDLPPVTKPKPTPTPAKAKPATPKPAGANPASEGRSSTVSHRPANTPALTFNQPLNANLEAQASGRIATGNYYNEYVLNAKASDLLAFQFQPDNPALRLLIYDQARSELPIVKDSMTGDYRLDTPTGTLPADGEYRVRILNPGEDKKPQGGYLLKVIRTGMTEAAYQARLQTIVEAFKASGAPGADAAIKQLKSLVTEDEGKPGAYELLGVVYLYYKADAKTALDQMEKAIKQGGAGLFRIAYDAQWRRPRRVGNAFDWEERKVAWLRVHDGRVILADANDPNQHTLSLLSAQVREVELQPVAPVIVVQALPRRTLPFSPATRSREEAELLVKLLQTYVIKRSK